VAGARILTPEDNSRFWLATSVVPIPSPSRPNLSEGSPSTPWGLAPASGYDWFLEPAGHGVGWFGGRTHWMVSRYHVVEVDDGDLLITFGHGIDSNSPAIGEFRAVVFDRQRNRHLARWERTTSCTNEFGASAAVEQFRLSQDDLPADKVGFLGI